jgi:hypothetical protein
VSDERISLKELRTYLGPHAVLYDFTLPGPTVLALVEAVEAAQIVANSDSFSVHDNSSLLVDALARFKDFPA